MTPPTPAVCDRCHRYHRPGACEDVGGAVDVFALGGADWKSVNLRGLEDKDLLLVVDPLDQSLGEDDYVQEWIHHKAQEARALGLDPEEHIENCKQIILSRLFSRCRARCVVYVSPTMPACWAGKHVKIIADDTGQDLHTWTLDR